MTSPETNEEFRKRAESYESESTEDFINRYSRTHEELRETIAYLIRHREMLRDLALKTLQTEADQLILKLQDIDRERLIEELRCFRDILALQRRLVQSEDASDVSRNRGD